MSKDIAARAREAHAHRWETPGPDYPEPVPTGVVHLGDWASEELPELIAELEACRCGGGDRYLCDKCGCDIGKRICLTAHLASGDDLQFCSIGCLTDWAADSGYRDDDDHGWPSDDQ